MTLTQFGIILNVAGLLVPLLFSLSIARTYSRPYFSNWVISYAFFLATIVAFLLPAPPAAVFVLDCLKIAFIQLGAWYLIKTAETLKVDRIFHGRVQTFWWLITVLAFVQAVVGLPFTVVSVGPVLLLVGAHLLMAYELFRLSHPQKHHTKQRLGALVGAVGLWTLAYPLLGGSGTAWLGFALSGVLHLIIGVDMVIFLLEDVALVLRRQNESLMALDRLKSDFISTVSHELRTPLSSIKSATWLLQNHRTPVTEDELIGTISNQVDVLQRLVNDVLDFAKMESGTLSYKLQPVELMALARAVVNDATPSFTEKGIDLEFDSASARSRVEADPDRLAQVIGNLLSNALKFTAPGGHVTVRLHSEDGWARLAVQDDGVGVPADQRMRIFERFYQVDNSSTRRVGGAGLGLAISRAIIEEGHHGRIWVEDTPGGGSTFFIALSQADETVSTKGLESRSLRE
jgi:signal transduction histidine kinase